MEKNFTLHYASEENGFEVFKVGEYDTLEDARIALDEELFSLNPEDVEFDDDSLGAFASADYDMYYRITSTPEELDEFESEMYDISENMWGE